MKKFATSLLMTKQEDQKTITTQTLHVNVAESREEAIGKAVPAGMKLKPGFAVVDILSLEVKDVEEAPPAAANDSEPEPQEPVEEK